MALLLAILQTATLMVLQHPMLSAVVPVAETAVPDDSLRRLSTVLVGTSDLLRRHTTKYRQREVDSRRWDDVERRYG